MNNSQENTQPTGGKKKTYLIAGIILVVILLIANADSISEKRSGEPSDETNSDMIVSINEDGEETSLPVDNLIQGFSPDEFPELITAQETINQAQGKPLAGDETEEIVFYITNAQDEGVVYFATYNYNQEDNQLFSGIYRYNTLSHRWQRVYKQTVEGTDEAPPTQLRVLGRLDNHLILMNDKFGNSPGPCADPWLIGAHEDFGLTLLNLDDPYSTFTSFELPEEFRQEKEQQQSECEASLR